MIKTCKCAHEQQDRMHGKGSRVHNPATDNGNPVWRCTVCGSQQPREGRSPDNE